MIARSSRCVRQPAFRSIVAWAIDPAMSCRQSRQSKEMDSVNCATAAAGPPANRPLRETGEVFFMRFARVECAPKRRGKSLPKKALSSPGRRVESLALEAMSEFKFACPVCGQHITADSSTSGGQIECPTCFQKIVVPQAPASAGHQVHPLGRPGGQTPPRFRRGRFPTGPPATARPARSSIPAVVALLVLLCAAGAALFRLPRPDLQALPARRRRPAPTPRCRSQPPRSPLNTTYPVPTNIIWTLDLTNAVFPETPAAGRIHGSGFLCEQAVLQGGLLSLSQGKAWPWDLGIAVDLIARQGEELSGKTVEIAPDQPHAPRVVLRWKDEQQQPATETISNGYAAETRVWPGHQRAHARQDLPLPARCGQELRRRAPSMRRSGKPRRQNPARPKPPRPKD